MTEKQNASLIVTDEKQLAKTSKKCSNSKQTLAKLWDALEKTPDCIGLAANQIGIQEKVIVIKFKDVDEKEVKEEFVNPVIVKQSTTNIGQPETCLSYPNMPEILVMRPEWVTVKDDLAKQRKLTGYLARIFLHEFDHFKGGCGVLSASQAVKVGRNDPCPCESGKKFKKCCG